MKIIDHIEIRYFRSIHTTSLSSLKDLNVVVGGNDVGKSNLLKALNLFFNEEVSLYEDLDFDRDLNRRREIGARDAKGRATIWMKVTFNNFLKWGSLPEKFTIKKSWNRYDDNALMTYPKGVTNTSIGKFLKKISFHYVTALRSREIFSYYLELLHDSLFENEDAGIREASADLLALINESTSELSAKIKSGLGLDSEIQVPENLRELFSAFDFSTQFGESKIPLQLRGEGIQSRHIPFILDFIAQHSRRHHIWAYEEPENSLEMAGAFQLADQFKSDFSVDNQIFLTTHSPAFYDLEGPTVTRWLVESIQPIDRAHPETTVTAITDVAESDERLGIAQFVKDRARQLYDERAKLEADNLSLRQKIEDNQQPLLLVEGPTDKLIFEEAARRAFGDDQGFRIEYAGGFEPAIELLRVNAAHPGVARFPIFALLDNQPQVRSAIDKAFRGNENVDGFVGKVVELNHGFYCCTLPIPQRIEELRPNFEQAGWQADQLTMILEQGFPPDVIGEALDNGILTLEPYMRQIPQDQLPLRINLSELVAEKLPEEYAFLAYKFSDGTKAAFSQWVINRDDADFQYFIDVLNQIKPYMRMP